jgi:competence protein ComEC
MNIASEKVRPIYWRLLFVLAMMAALSWVAVWQLAPEPVLKVNFYDVGQGDAIFVKTSGGARVLIDGGPGGRILQKVASDLPFFDRRIDLVILTHPHADHVAGLIEVLRRYDVKRALFSPIIFESDYWREFLKLLDEKKVQKIIARSGQTVTLDKNTTLSILAPTGSVPAGKVADPNDFSVVSRLSYGQSDFLLLGDAGVKEVGKITPDKDLQAEVVKIGHHGSASATTGGVLDKVGPDFAVISVGRKNKYNLPNSGVLALLESYKVSYARTDRDGDVRLVSRGRDVRILRSDWFFSSEQPIR